MGPWAWCFPLLDRRRHQSPTMQESGLNDIRLLKLFALGSAWQPLWNGDTYAIAVSHNAHLRGWHPLSEVAFECRLPTTLTTCVAFPMQWR